MESRQQQTLKPDGFSLIPSPMLPSFRTAFAVQNGVEKRLLLKTWGGLGDQICAEPTLRFALKTFKGCSVSLASEHPELFRHLVFTEVFDLNKVQPHWDRFLAFDTIRPPTDLLWEFMSHMLVNCVDYPSLCAFRCQLPVKDREVKLEPSAHDIRATADIMRGAGLKDFMPYVVIHPGRHWQSKTFPVEWWNAVLAELINNGVKPILIGADTGDNRSTVDVNPTGCVDLRNKLSIMQCVALLMHAHVLLTNDSSPLHMAAPSNAWIGFIATCKHPDYITHWRNGQWGWRMENLGLGGIWDVLDFCPNKENTVEVENVGDELLRSWLPDPKDFARWGIQKLEYREDRGELLGG